MIEHAVLFVIMEALKLGISPCFGVRFELEMLPKGSSVVGFMKWDPNAGVIQLLNKPHMNKTQGESWEAALVYAERSLKMGREDMDTEEFFKSKLV